MSSLRAMQGTQCSFSLFARWFMKSLQIDPAIELPLTPDQPVITESHHNI